MEEKTHTKSIVEISRGGILIFVLQKQINTMGGGGGVGGWLYLGDERVGGNYVVVFQASLIMCFKYCANVVSVILNINLMYWQSGYNDITMHLV